MPTPNHQPPSQWTAPPFRLALGTMAFDRAKGEASPEALLERAAQAGIRAIDTAPLYGFGEVESRIGQWFRAHGKVFEVWTKAGLEWDEAGHGEILFETESSSGKRLVVRRDSRPESLLRSIERSLERLGVEAIDLIQIHQRDRLVPLDESLSALFDAWRAKKVKAIGVSNFTPKDLDEGARVILRLSGGGLSLATAQYPLSLIDQKAKRDVFPVARRHGLGFLAYSPLGQGLLSGAFT
ncbi:MAG: aldo/keto reductase, partial [Deltaproteobacteria bacterium]|nr:aldo/keto reductase [Deltaproteobacteria bacterium]